MKKLVTFLMMLLLLFSLFGCNAFEKTTPIESFEYDFEDGEAIITRYIGEDFNVNIPSEIEERPVTTIGESAFEDCNVTSVKFPETITKINEYAFKGCDSIESIKLPESLTFIGSGAFDDCAITTLEIPDNVSFDWRGAYTASKNYMQRIFSPVRDDVVLIVREGTKAHEELEKDKELDEKYNKKYGVDGFGTYFEVK